MQDHTRHRQISIPPCGGPNVAVRVRGRSMIAVIERAFVLPCVSPRHPAKNHCGPGAAVTVTPRKEALGKYENGTIEEERDAKNNPQMRFSYAPLASGVDVAVAAKEEGRGGYRPRPEKGSSHCELCVRHCGATCCVDKCHTICLAAGRNRRPEPQTYPTSRRHYAVARPRLHQPYGLRSTVYGLFTHGIGWTANCSGNMLGL